MYAFMHAVSHPAYSLMRYSRLLADILPYTIFTTCITNGIVLKELSLYSCAISMRALEDIVIVGNIFIYNRDRYILSIHTKIQQYL